MESTGASLETNAERDDFVKCGMLETMTLVFLGSASPKDPLANLLYADLAGLLSVYVQVGTAEALLDDSRRLVARIQAAGARSSWIFTPICSACFTCWQAPRSKPIRPLPTLRRGLSPDLGCDAAKFADLNSNAVNGGTLTAFGYMAR